jgi:6-phosphogluconate dehydrogenase
MAGGDKKWINLAMPIFDALRPEGERDEASCTPARSGRGTTPRWFTTASSTA